MRIPQALASKTAWSQEPGDCLIVLRMQALALKPGFSKCGPPSITWRGLGKPRPAPHSAANGDGLYSLGNPGSRGWESWLGRQGEPPDRLPIQEQRLTSDRQGPRGQVASVVPLLKFSSMPVSKQFGC